MRLTNILLIMFSFFSYNSSSTNSNNTSFYDLTINSIDGDVIDFSSFKGKNVLIVNVASYCGFTGQYKALEKLFTENNILLIFDEVQTGFGRTGEMFGANTVGVTPDMATLAKGIAGGFPLAGVIGKSNIMDSIHNSESIFVWVDIYWYQFMLVFIEGNL